MGTSDVMNGLIAKEIRSLYSSYDGWKSTSRSIGKGYDSVISLERRNSGHLERVNILVTLSKKIPMEYLAELTKMNPVTDGTLSRNAYGVMIPGNADTSTVPAGTRIYTMRSFAFEGKELAWVKKPVRKTEASVQAST
jgi:hypothetical protein